MVGPRAFQTSRRRTPKRFGAQAGEGRPATFVRPPNAGFAKAGGRAKRSALIQINAQSAILSKYGAVVSDFPSLL
jgi:hypothetical protein